MSKMLNATCDSSGKVTAEGFEVPEAVVLSAGKQASSGALIIDKKIVKYFTSNASDIETFIDKTSTALDDISAALTKIALTLTSIGAGMTGPTTAPPPTLGADVATINSKVSEINAVKAELDTLKGALK
jgi:prefoldin subunit 5